MNDIRTTISMTPRRRLYKVGQVYEIFLLLVIVHATWVASPMPFDASLKIQALSAAGNILGTQSVLQVLQFLPVLKILLLAMLLLWITRRARRWTFVLAPLTFILLMSCVVETQYFSTHQTNFAAVAFLVLGATRFYAATPDQLQQRVANKSKGGKIDPFASSALPEWAFLLLIFYIGISYSMSALTKIHYSGWQWCDGKALMVWVDTWSRDPNDILARLISSNTYLAAMLQTTTFIVELSAVLMLLFPKLRPICGIALVGFHLSVEHLMGLGFYANIFLDSYLLIVCFSVPEYRIGLADVYPAEKNSGSPLRSPVAVPE